jgi:hypothetical protein
MAAAEAISLPTTLLPLLWPEKTWAASVASPNTLALIS